MALIHDALHIFALGLQELDASSNITSSEVCCVEEKPLQCGPSLTNFLNTVEYKGITGRISFKNGARNSLKLDLIKLKQNVFVKCGEWDHVSGLSITDFDSLFEGNQMNTT